MCVQGFSYLWDKEDRLEGHLSFGRKVTVGKWFFVVLTREGTGEWPSQEAMDVCTLTGTHESMYTYVHVDMSTHRERSTYTCTHDSGYQTLEKDL